MITNIGVKELGIPVCSGVNLITGRIHNLNDVVSSIGSMFPKIARNDKINLISWEVDNQTDYAGGQIVVWNRPEKWLHPADMRDLATRIKTLADSGSQVFVLTTEDLLASWLSVEAEISTTPLSFKFFNLYNDNTHLCMEEFTTSEHFRHSAVGKAYSDLIDFKIRLAMGGLGK